MDSLLQSVDTLIYDLINWLPGSPFTALEFNGFDDFFSYSNYFIDLQSLAVIGESWLLAIIAYNAIRTIAKWVKMAG